MSHIDQIEEKKTFLITKKFPIIETEKAGEKNPYFCNLSSL